MDRFFHSVSLDKDACKGCTHCVKRCPTEAIRVRDGKARIIKERCIDCGECIRVCPYHAKKVISDPLSAMDKFRYKIALPAPALYGQFNNLEDPDILLTALKKLGFDMVYEVSQAAELVSSVTRHLMKDPSFEVPRPVISCACPAVVRLIRVRFPSLLDHLLPLQAPVDMAAHFAKAKAHTETGIPMDEIGAVFISPCPAKVTAIKMPLGLEKSQIDAVVAISEVYPSLVSRMKEVQNSTEELTNSGRTGIRWSTSGGEAAATLNERYLAADGIENVIKVLEDLEDEKFQDLDFVELNACSAGCVGGVLTVENPYIAEAKIKQLTKYQPVSRNHAPAGVPEEHLLQKAVEYEPVMRLGEDFQSSMKMMAEVEELAKQFCGLDCGSCGAPSCRALAEDVVKGFSTREACIFVVRDQLQAMANEIEKLSHLLPGLTPRKEEDKK